MNKDRKHRTISNWLRRGISGVLSLALVLGLLPGLAQTAQAAQQSWAMPYAQQLVDWGVMRGDINGNLNLGNAITRAEFVTMMNRAYGYTKMGGTPFTDVRSTDWYAQDIDIAYNMGYFKGTSPTTASPMAPVTREQAAVLLTRNLMLQETVGETLGFSDSRTLAEWSRGLIGAAAANGVINGYDDGSFRPRSNITRGEVAAMLVRAIGTPVNEPGDHTLGAVYGNVTINTPGVNLRNSVITGNLYLTGGVDLGDVLLENVNVLGQIIVSGAGESSSSQSSILLRNVEADEMIVDSISNQFVTIRAEGNTSIGTTKVRTNAYIDDSSLPGFGLSFIELDGDNGSLLQLAGNVKEVVNKTPSSNLQVVQGTAQKITIDEKAVGSNVLVDANTRVDELDLDIGAAVTGTGDIKNLNVGAAGSSVEKLPDSIYIRPGITSDIAGNNMTSSTAAESSADPRLLAGYPKVEDVAPTSATAVFSTNKAGTIYWAVSAVADGSVKEDDLIKPPVYGGKAVKSGNLKAAASNTEYTAKVTGLITDGSYYLSAVMVDDRGNRSPLKVTAFTTPDNTTPAFTTGYPLMTKVTTETAQVTAMTNKSCLLYYALLPSGSTAPKAAEFKANAITGNLGYGVVDMVKNVTQPINVNSNRLSELTKYDLYLWLTDYDGAKSSAVRKLTFTTPDETPPTITYIEQNLSRTSGTAIGVTYALDEPGTLHWVLYADNETNAFAVDFGRDKDDTNEDGTSRWRGKEVTAKAFVKAGLSSVKKGSSNASKAATDISFAISGLNSKTTGTTSYMLYVVAEDKAGNLCNEVIALNVRTLDTDPPKVTQEFTKVDTDNPDEPMVDTDIRLVFDESVQGNPQKNEKFYELYSKVMQLVQSGANAAEVNAARIELETALREHITMFHVDANGRAEEVPVRGSGNPAPTDWTIDYRYAQVSIENGSMVITFPTTADTAANPSALKLDSGATYYFVLNSIYDQALTPNVMNKGAPVKLSNFRVVFARVAVDRGDIVSIGSADGGAAASRAVDADISFVVDPLSVDRVENAMLWDMLLWTDTTMTYELYSRPKDSTGAWHYEGETNVIVSGMEDGFVYRSLRKHFQGESTFKQLNQMGNPVDSEATVTSSAGHGAREYAVYVTKIGEDTNRNAWNHRVNMRVTIAAGHHQGLTNLANGSYASNLATAKVDYDVATIGQPDPRELYKQFTDTEPPIFVENYPVVRTGDISATVEVMIDRPGYVYYVAVPVTDLMEGAAGTTPVSTTGQLTDAMVDNVTKYGCSVLPTAYAKGREKNAAGTYEYITSMSGLPMPVDVPSTGGTLTEADRLFLSAPGVSTVVAGGFIGSVRSGRTNQLRANISDTINLANLSPNTLYYLYLVTQGTSAVYEEYVECYRFITKEAVRPSINAGISGTNVNVQIYDTPTATLDYILVRTGAEDSQFNKPFTSCIDTANLSSVPAAYQAATFTVLDAMATPVQNGTTYLGTAFDLYANTASKNLYAGLIRNEEVSGSNVVMKGSNQQFTAANNNQKSNQIACTGMTAGNYYTMLIVGNSPMGSGDAFRVVYPIRMNDTTPPMVQNAIIAVKEWDGSKIKDGTITLVFSEGLYANTQSGTTQKTLPVDNCILGADGHTAAAGSYTAVGSLVTTTANAGVTVNGSDDHDDGVVQAPISTIELNVNDVQDGFGISFRNTICDADGNGLNRGALTVTIKVTKTGTGEDATYSASLNITSSWDARTSK